MLYHSEQTRQSNKRNFLVYLISASRSLTWKCLQITFVFKVHCSYLGTFADDTEIMDSDAVQENATDRLQVALTIISGWMKDLQIIYTYATTKKDHMVIAQVELSKYLCLHLDGRINWKHYDRRLTGQKFKFHLLSNRLIYQSIIRNIFGLVVYNYTVLKNRTNVWSSNVKAELYKWSPRLIDTWRMKNLINT